MSSSMETELLKSDEPGEHITWKEREIVYWEQKAKKCPGRKWGARGLYCKETGDPCEVGLCTHWYWSKP